jgi:hypothetical protein
MKALSHAPAYGLLVVWTGTGLAAHNAGRPCPLSSPEQRVALLESYT